MVTSVQAEAGQVVAAGQSVMKLAREDEREVAIAVPESRLGELKGRAVARSSCCGRTGRREYPAASARSRRASTRSRARSPCASRCCSRCRAAVGHDRERRAAGRGHRRRRVVPLTSIHREGDARGVELRPADAAGRDLRRSTIAQYREDGVIVDSGVRPATRSSPPACTSCCPARRCGRTKGRGRGVRAERAASRAARAPKLAAERPGPACRPSSRPARRAASTCPNGRCATARWCCTSSSCSRSPACCRTSGSGSRRTRRSRSSVMVVRTQLAGRRPRATSSAGHRPHRAQAAGDARRRLHAQLLASPASRWCSSRSRIRRPPTEVPETLVPGAQEDRRHPPRRCPPGIQGPFFNDEFGDIYRQHLRARPATASRYARAARTTPTSVRAELLRVPGVAKVDFFGEQDEKIYVEISQRAARDARHRRRRRSSTTLDAQNAVAPAGVFDTADRPRATCAPSGAFDYVDSDPRHRDPRQRPRRSASATSPTVTRGYVDPPAAEDALQRQGGARHRRHDGARAATSSSSASALDAKVARIAARRCRSGIELAAGRRAAARGAALGRRVRARRSPRRW